MHRVTALFFLLVTAALLAVTAMAQEPPPRGEVIPLPSDIFPQLISGGVWEPVKLERVDPSEIDFSLLADINPGADTCSAAPILRLDPPGASAGSQMTVNEATEAGGDPVLTCMYGNPPTPRSRRGYRTVWYRFTAPISGNIVVSSEPNADHEDNYDTVIGVFSGSCDSLTMVACNDDADGLLSETIAPVEFGQIYYIEVADRSLGVDGDAILNLFAYVEEPDSFWQTEESTMPTYAGQTRHAVVMVGAEAYVIAGQTGNTKEDNPIRTPYVYRYNTVTGDWHRMCNMPGPDAFGYSNSTAAYKNGLIFMPSGYVGDNNDYAGAHWRFDPAGSPSCVEFGGRWSTVAPVPWPNDEALGYLAAVADPTRDGYYITGGIDDEVLTTTSTVYNDVWFYSIPNNTWSPRVGMTTARYAHVADWLGGRLCVAGGITHDEDQDLAILLSDAECLGGGQWRAIAPLNIPRFNAGSAVSPDGLWYVFGGTAADGSAIATTEVYNPATNTWQMLDYRYDLSPSRSWPRGGFVGETLWVFGGEKPPDGETVPLVEKIDNIELASLGHQTLQPLLFANAPLGVPGDTILNAEHLVLNVPEFHSFDEPTDRFDTFFFDLSVQQQVTIKLTDIPADANYDIEVYNANKQLAGWGDSPLQGTPEEVAIVGLPGRYYILVILAFDADPLVPDGYQILVEG